MLRFRLQDNPLNERVRHTLVSLGVLCYLVMQSSHCSRLMPPRYRATSSLLGTSRRSSYDTPRIDVRPWHLADIVAEARHVCS